MNAGAPDSSGAEMGRSVTGGGPAVVLDAFAELGLPRRLALDADEVRERFHEASRSRHPDARAGARASSAGAGDFERLNDAQAILSDPARRVRHWLDLEVGAPGGEGTAGGGGAIAPGIMDLFSAVGEVIAAADRAVARRREARTPLARALLEREVLAVQRRVVEAQGRIGRAVADAEGRFAEIDALAAAGDRDRAVRMARDCHRELAFLVKWRAQLQERFGLLFA